LDRVTPTELVAPDVLIDASVHRTRGSVSLMQKKQRRPSHLKPDDPLTAKAKPQEKMAKEVTAALKALQTPEKTEKPQLQRKMDEEVAAARRQLSLNQKKIKKTEKKDKSQVTCDDLTDKWDPGWDKNDATKGLEPCGEWLHNKDWGAMRKSTSGQRISLPLNI